MSDKYNVARNLSEVSVSADEFDSDKDNGVLPEATKTVQGTSNVGHGGIGTSGMALPTESQQTPTRSGIAEKQDIDRAYLMMQRLTEHLMQQIEIKLRIQAET